MKKIISMLLCVMMLITALPLIAVNAGDSAPLGEIPFSDVKSGKWYTSAVIWCYEKGYMSGVSNTVFGVNNPVTRSMFVTILAKIAGADLSGYAKNTEGLPFTDIKGTAYYIKALKWAYENKYTSGVSATNFGPNNPVSREQLATFLYAYAKAQGKDVSAAVDLSSYADGASVSKYAKTAVAWAIAADMISGTGGNNLSPKANATRAQIAVIVKKFVENVIAKSPKAEVSFDGTTAIFTGAKELVSVIAAKGCAVNMDEYEAALKYGSSYEGNHGEDSFTMNGLYGSNTLCLYYSDGSCELVYHYFDPGTEYPVGSVTLGGSDISEYTIVYGSTAKQRKITAKKLADALAARIKDATGAELAVYADTDLEAVEGAKEILIGKTNREDAGFVTVDRTELALNTLYIEVKGNYVILASNENCAGTHMAVYEFLRRIGVTYYAKDLYHIEPAEKYELDDGAVIKIRPGMDFNINYQLDGWELYLGEPSETGLWFCNGVHSLPELAQPDFEPTWDYHVKYYMSPDPCLSDPNVINTMIKNVKTQAQYAIDHGNPNPLIWMTLTDGAARGCQCKACTTTYGALGVHSTYSYIINYVGEAIKDEYPTARLVGLAYKYTVTAPRADVTDEAYAQFVASYTAVCEKNGWSTDYIPPQDPKAPENAIMCVATDNSCFSHAIDDPDCTNRSNSNVKFNENFERWCDIYDTIYVWDYFNGDAYKHCPFPNIYEIWENYNYYYRHNVTGMYGLGDTSRYADFSELRTYVVAQLSMYPEMSEADYFLRVNKFLEVFYGEGWKEIREYIDLTEELSAKNEWHIWTKCRWNNIITEDDYRANIAHILELWQAAYDAAGTNALRYNVKSSAVSAKYIELMLAYADYSKSKSAADLQSFQKLNQAFVVMLDECGYERPSNWSLDGNPNYWKQ